MQNHRITRTRPTRPTRQARQIHHLAAGAVIAAGGMLLGLGQTAAAAAPAIQQDDDIVFQIAEQTCPKSGKVDVAGDHLSLQVTAPADKLIAGWCVKAGSANQGDGPEHHVVDPPATQVTISHSSGKAISHYTLVLVDRPLTDPDPGDDPDPDPDHPGDLVHPDPDPVDPDPVDPDPDHPGDLVNPDPDPEQPNEPVDPQQPNEPVEPVEPNEPPVEIAVLPGTPDEAPTATIPAPTTGGDAPEASDAPAAPDVDVPEVVEMLPSTGVNSGLLALLAGLFVAAGGALTRTGRRLDV